MTTTTDTEHTNHDVRPCRIATIQKRNSRIVPFDPSRISAAIIKAGRATDQFDELIAESLTSQVLELADSVFRTNTPSVEQIQDLVAIQTDGQSVHPLPQSAYEDSRVGFSRQRGTDASLPRPD